MRGALDLKELYAASYSRLVMQIFAVFGDMARAEDAVQDAFVTAIRKRRNGETWVEETTWR